MSTYERTHNGLQSQRYIRSPERHHFLSIAAALHATGSPEEEGIMAMTDVSMVSTALSVQRARGFFMFNDCWVNQARDSKDV